MQQIHLVSPMNVTKNELVERIVKVHKRATCIHIRQKNWSEAEVGQCVADLVFRGVPRKKIIVNSYPALASDMQVGGVHLPEAISLQHVRESYPKLTIGASVHTLASASRKEAEGADYLFFGHIFPTPSKKDVQPKGLYALAEITKAVSIPVIAIGGISPSNVSQIEAAGAKGIAVLSYVLLDDDPLKAIHQLCKREVER